MNLTATTKTKPKLTARELVLEAGDIQSKANNLVREIAERPYEKALREDFARLLRRSPIVIAAAVEATKAEAAGLAASIQRDRDGNADELRDAERAHAAAKAALAKAAERLELAQHFDESCRQRINSANNFGRNAAAEISASKSIAHLAAQVAP